MIKVWSDLPRLGSLLFFFNIFRGIELYAFGCSFHLSKSPITLR